jgi:hypothetical protein
MIATNDEPTPRLFCISVKLTRAHALAGTRVAHSLRRSFLRHAPAGIELDQLGGYSATRCRERPLQ